MTNHTPTPWYHRIDFNQVGSIENGDGKIIAQVQSYESGDHARRDVDAAHIVHCVNLHDGLVTLVAELADDLEAEIEARRRGELPRRIERDLSIVKQARAVLAKAKGKTDE